MAADVRSLITRYANKYGIDPRAAIAVAMGEGGLKWGAVGDNGTSYGPFQLHVGGALPKGKDAGWANSPAGVEYAIRSMAQHARGLTGREAIEAIVRKFERPLDPDKSIQLAWGRYGGLDGAGGGSAAPSWRSGAQPSPPSVTRPSPAPSSLDQFMLGNLSDLAAGTYDPVESLTKLTSLMPQGLVPNSGGLRFPRAHPRSTVPKGSVPIVQEAMRWLGTPYSWAGGGLRGPSRGVGRGANTVGFDCSGLLQYLWGKRGVKIPRVTYQQWRAGFAPKDGLKPGDAVFFRMGKQGPEHVGMYVGAGRFIHAPKTGDVVKISSLADAYYKRNYVGARRYG